MDYDIRDTRVRRLSKREIGIRYATKLQHEAQTRDIPIVNFFSNDYWEGLKKHFHILPQRYAQDVNLQGVDPVQHFLLLQSARNDPESAFFSVKLLEKDEYGEYPCAPAPAFGSKLDLLLDGPPPAFALGADGGLAPMPSFMVGTPKSPEDLQGLAAEADEDEERNRTAHSQKDPALREFEIVLTCKDGHGTAAKLASLLTNLDLDIAESHLFTSDDRYCLNIYVTRGWLKEEFQLQDALREALKGFADLEIPAPRKDPRTASLADVAPTTVELLAQEPPPELAEEPPPELAPPQGPQVDWDIDEHALEFGDVIARGAYGDLFKGRYHDAEVAIKHVRDNNPQGEQEFLQEVAMMRKARHKNIVQLIGVLNKKDKQLLIFEYMSGGSVADWIKKQGGHISVERALRIAKDAAAGMDYLHKINIIHRDLKAANLLIDETSGIVKVSDFGVARVIDEVNVMTAETGTYRWMAPEVIEHQWYDAKADVYAFGITLWELLMGDVPYGNLQPVQAAIAVVQKNLRPPLPGRGPPGVDALMERCWSRDAKVRPTFAEIKVILAQLHERAKEREDKGQHEDDRPPPARPIDIRPPGGAKSGFLSQVFNKGQKK